MLLHAFINHLQRVNCHVSHTQGQDKTKGTRWLKLMCQWQGRWEYVFSPIRHKQGRSDGEWSHNLVRYSSLPLPSLTCITYIFFHRQ